MELLTLKKRSKYRLSPSRSVIIKALVADAIYTLSETDVLLSLLADIRTKGEATNPLEIFIKKVPSLDYETLRFSALSLEEINNRLSDKTAKERHFWSSLVKYNPLVAIIAYALYDDEIIGKEILQMSTAEIEQVVKNKIGR